MPFHPSPRQSAIAEKMTQPVNILVQACAGSGKTTTMVWLAGLLPPHLRILALSFNKIIAEELGRRMPQHVRSATMHSVGFGMVRRANRRVQLDERKLQNIIDTHPGVVVYQNEERASIMTDLLNIVPLAQDTMVDYNNISLLAALAEMSGRNLENPEKSLPLVGSIVAASDAMKNWISFTEMIRHPVIHDYGTDYYDVVFVDEAQDLNAAQHALLRKLVRPITGKLIAVGDRFQSIYGFRGADCQSMDRLREDWSMVEMPLDICYRCGSDIIVEAQKIAGADTIKPHPEAETGTVSALATNALAEHAQEGDMILCRINAPLVPLALKMLKMGKKAIIRGRDIGASLAAMVRRSKATTVPELVAWVMDWKRKKLDAAARSKKSDTTLQAITDQAETLIALSEECATPAEVLNALAHLFDDNRKGVVCSTVHKAKGLEEDRVYLYGPELLPAPWAKSPQEIAQEKNIAYVAVTRAKRTLIRVPLPPRNREED